MKLALGNRMRIQETFTQTYKGRSKSPWSPKMPACTRCDARRGCPCDRKATPFHAVYECYILTCDQRWEAAGCVISLRGDPQVGSVNMAMSIAILVERMKLQLYFVAVSTPIAYLHGATHCIGV